MYIPSYWASHTLAVTYKNKQTKIKRYGWSDESVEAAEQHAIERCKKAEHTLLTSGSVKRIEPKGSYFIEGLPIREEVINKYSDLNCVTTINVYGATCLNTEDVMILDIDNDDLEHTYIKNAPKSYNSPPKKISQLWALLPPLSLMVIARISDIRIESGLQIFLVGILVGFFVWLLASVNSYRWNKWLNKQGGLEGMLYSCVMSFIEKYPSMAFNIYKTPLGFRLIALDKTYSPTDTSSRNCFDELPVDRKYAHLCQMQNCFRARVTAKPWNIEECEPRIPIKDFWLQGQMRKEREEWLQHYHELEPSYAACHFIEQVGTRRSIVPNSDQQKEKQHVDSVIALHDTLSRSHSSLPLA